ncbi:MAG: dihydrofolate reductase family protein, partial [Planctomycetota bacterium]|nr:dihydrofolate reductase family protein [Planctomycetota bacterium]
MPWPAFLQARRLLESDVDAVQFVRRGAWICEPLTEPMARGSVDALLVEVAPGSLDEADDSAPVYRIDPDGLPVFHVPAGAALEPELAAAARVYLPILIGAARARRAGESFVAGHVTQTLDGRIACENGQSQWIGNAADQHHSHRMRALLDGVM